MPVQLEMIEQASPDDLQDLAKIYKHYQQNPESWLQQQLNSDHRLFAGRFNSRLLGALWVSEPNSGHWLLQHLCVRDITRRRGVARQLMQLLAKHAQTQQATLVVEASSLTAELASLLTELGFKNQQQQWLLAPKSD